MTTNNKKTSLLIPSQLPEFIRDNTDYEKFVAFIQAYYEWLELSDTANAQSIIESTTKQGATYAAKNILNYSDIDRTTEDFLNYFINDFLPYFPEDALVNKRLATKVARQLYQSKGTPASYQFLFRILYDSDFDYFPTKDVVLRASGGTWYVPRLVRLLTTDRNFFNVKGLKLLGETSGAFAVIENTILTDTKIEVYISNINRNFITGEFVRVVGNENQDFLINGNVLRAKISGQVTDIAIDTKNRGLLYNVGDPVVVYGGINPEITSAIEATAQVGEVSTGSIIGASVIASQDGTIGGFGYSNSAVTGAFSNTNLIFSGAPRAAAHIGEFYSTGIANVTLPTDTIGPKANVILSSAIYYFANDYFFAVDANVYSTNEIVYQGPQLSNTTSNTFSGNVVLFSTTTNIVYTKNNTGYPANSIILIGNTSTSTRNVTSYLITNGRFTLDATANLFTTGEVVYQPATDTLANSTFRGYVGEYYSANNTLRLANAQGTPVTSANLKGFTSGNTRVLTSANLSGANIALTVANNNFYLGETVYQGNSLANATFTSSVRRFDTTTNILYLNISSGRPTNLTSITGVSSNTSRSIRNIWAANANTRLANALSFITFPTFPIKSVVLDSGDSGLLALPTLIADSVYNTDNVSAQGHIASLGILSPIQIANCGQFYKVNDVIQIIGGSGYGAYANVTNVFANGGINTISYVSGTYLSPNNNYPPGGMGYRVDALPRLNVVSSNATANGASVFLPGILGTGANFSLSTSQLGQIIKISVTNYGQDYSSQPDASLRVVDLLVANVGSVIPAKGDIIYQGTSVAGATYSANVDSITPIQIKSTPSTSLYNLRLYNYTGSYNFNSVLKVQDKQIFYTAQSSSMLSNPSAFKYNANGVILYGDSTAKANVKFSQGQIIGDGDYISTTGTLSGSDVLQSEIYNDFTYEITVEKEIAKYREILLNLLHPSGLKVLGKYKVYANSDYYLHGVDATSNGKTLLSYVNTATANLGILTDFTNKSNNILRLYNLGVGVNIANIIFANTTTLCIFPTNGPNVSSQVLSVNYSANSVTIKNNVWLTYSNVAIANTKSGSNLINIISLTGTYDDVNNGRYSNTLYPLKDIVYVGDTISVAGSTGVVKSIDYALNTITLTTNFSANANTYLSVNRTFNALANQVQIFGPLGLEYIPELTTEDGSTLTTEDGFSLIILG
jgi:hypothetical protein